MLFGKVCRAKEVFPGKRPPQSRLARLPEERTGSFSEAREIRFREREQEPLFRYPAEKIHGEHPEIRRPGI